MTTPAPSRDTSSSVGKVFAKASKEWTIPPRPRPGRKAAETAPKTGKSAQNREAQRAFRERKQDYVAELEQRCRDYEQEEVQKNISLQTISLALKAESVALKAENQTLKSDNDRLKALVAQLGGDSTVTPGSSASGSSTRAGATGRKRKKVKVEEFEDGAGEMGSRAGSASRSGSIVGEGSSTGEGWRGKSSPSSAYQQQEARRTPSSSSATPTDSNFPATNYFPSSFSTTLAGTSTSVPPPITSSHDHSSHSHAHPPPDPRPPTPTAATSVPFSYATSFVPSCGFCTTNDTPCICRMAAESRDLHAGFTGLLNSSDVSPKPSPTQAFGVDYPASQVSSSTGGGAVSLPSAYLRRRNSGASHQGPAAIWSYTSLASSSTANSSSSANFSTSLGRSINANPSSPSSVSLVAPIFNPSFGFEASNNRTVVAASSSDPNSLPSCTGNPQDCAACADDPFGKAFCETLEGAEADEGGEAAGGGGCSSSSGVPCGNCSETARSKAAGDGLVVELSCCGVPEACGSGSSTSSSCVDTLSGGGIDESGSHKKLVLGGGSSTRSRSSMSTSSFAGSEEPEGGDHHSGLMVPTSTAWRQFKSHPNTTFADLSLLAEVVSRRLPSCALSPNPHGSSSLPPSNHHAFASGSAGSPFAVSSSSSSVKLEEEDVSMGSNFGGGSVPPASRKRRRAEVEVEGVREALRILDARGKRGPGGEVLLTANGVVSVAPGVVEVAAGKTGRRMSDIRGTLDEFGMEQDEDEEEQQEEEVVTVRDTRGENPVGMMVMMA